MRAFDLLRHSRSEKQCLAGAFWAILLLSAGLSLIGARASFAGNVAPTHRELDRIADAVDDAESSHGTNPAMWRPNPAGPQGPMQVSDKAARDVGGGDRFDIAQNRAIGRAYLALLYRHYANWPDAVSAYNWGMGNLDSWIRAGRPWQKLVPAVAVYSRRVLAESGFCRSTLGTGRDCIGSIYGRDVSYLRSSSQGVPSSVSRERAIPGLEQSGRPLARLASSGDSLPGLEQSGQPLPSMQQSGRPLSSLPGAVRSRAGLRYEPIFP